MLTRARVAANKISGRGGIPIRELCQERVAWRRSRAALYRQSNKAARRLRDALNERGTKAKP